jgi:hypothetical protein
MLTTAERDLIQAANMAMDRLDRATHPAEIAKARTDLERIRSRLEKARDPQAAAFDAIRKSLGQPIDAITGTVMAKATPGRRVIDHRSDRFDKLQRTGALAK